MAWHGKHEGPPRGRRGAAEYKAAEVRGGGLPRGGGGGAAKGQPRAAEGRHEGPPKGRREGGGREGRNYKRNRVHCTEGENK